VIMAAGLRAIAKAVESPPAPVGARASSRPYRREGRARAFLYPYQFMRNDLRLHGQEVVLTALTEPLIQGFDNADNL
jgi:hypothetical protein